jgi:hypothetical protein
MLWLSEVTERIWNEQMSACGPSLSVQGRESFHSTRERNWLAMMRKSSRNEI